MILELFFKEKELIKKPWQLLFLAIVTSSMGVLLSLITFQGSESIVLIVFTIIPLIPIVIHLIKTQEKTLIRADNLRLKKIFFKHFTYVFLGLVLSYTLWYVALPPELSAQIFSSQIDGIYDLSGPYAFMTYQPQNTQYSCLSLGIDKTKSELIFDTCGISDYNKNGINEIVLSQNDSPKYVIVESGKTMKFQHFIAKHIFLNNIGVLIFILITAFFLGAGAIFILTWNASIIGVFIGDFVRTSTHFTGYPIFAFIYETPRVLSRLILHGIFEFGGFFCGAIAGSLISIVIVAQYKTRGTKIILLRDSFLMILLGILMIGIGAIIESYV